MKKILMISGLIILALFLVACARQGGESAFAGNAKSTGNILTQKEKNVVKSTAEKPFDVMKAQFTKLGVSEEQMWKEGRSANTFLTDFNGDMQFGFALRQINDPTVDAATKKATKEWVANKINKQYAGLSNLDQKNIATLIHNENIWKASVLKVSAFSTDLPLSPEGLKKQLDKTGEGGFLGGPGGYGGAGGATPAGGTPPPKGAKSSGSSTLDCVKGLSGSGAANTPKVEKKGTGAKPSVTDGSGDSTTTETGSQEGKSGVGSGAGSGCFDPMGAIQDTSGKSTGGGKGTSDTGNIHEYSNNPKDYSWSVTVDKGEGGKITVSFKADSVKENGIGEKSVSGKVTYEKVDGQGQKTTQSETVKDISPEKNKETFDGVKKEANTQKKENNAKGETTGVDTKAPKEGGDPSKSANPDADSSCQNAQAACASTPGQFSGANAQLKQLAQDCMNEGAKKGGSVETSGNNGGSSGNTEVKGSSGSQQPAPSACDKISPGCMKELSKGPVINTGGDSTTGSSCFALSGDALGFSKQAMVSDPADFVSKLGMSAQTAQTAQTSSAGAASSSKSATGSATGANSKAATGGANAQKATAGSGECVGDGCWG